MAISVRDSKVIMVYENGTYWVNDADHAILHTSTWCRAIKENRVGVIDRDAKLWRLESISALLRARGK